MKKEIDLEVMRDVVNKHSEHIKQLVDIISDLKIRVAKLERMPQAKENAIFEDTFMNELNKLRSKK